MTWSEFIYFVLPAIVLWIASGYAVYRNERVANLLMLCGMAIFALFIALFWVEIERAPMRTMGETRLWYSMFLSLVGYVSYLRWRYGWLLSFSAVVASIFVAVNLVRPEIHSKTLMPALQSVWFIPHVTSYILSYAMFGAATIGALIILCNKNKEQEILPFVDNIIYVGYGFLMLGLLMGALWAKDAWGHYWSWDPKECWAFITSAAYLGYIHLRLSGKRHTTMALALAILAFLLLMITWLGVGYLPSAQGSIHIY
ncbi:MAG: cytochrome c biogenesis protein CcsA [Rikenellaceae bacterium]